MGIHKFYIKVLKQNLYHVLTSLMVSKFQKRILVSSNLSKNKCKGFCPSLRKSENKRTLS